MDTVELKELRSQLNQYLKRVRTGERLVVTERGKPIAIISPPAVTPMDRRIKAMLREGIARWEGGKPKGASRPPRVKGPSVARALIEDRR